MSAGEAVAAALARARARTDLNAFTALLDERAIATASQVDRSGPLAGVPFAAKDLFDVAGRTTLAGSVVNRADPPAREDATAAARLEAAGAVLVGIANMDEYAYGFSTENAHYGPTRNPHDPTRIAGGSSGGSAAAVAAGIVPLALGSDTNGSIRVPASLCGVWGLKPTFGRLGRGGCYPFVADLDHVGPFARDLSLLARAYDAMAGADPRDPACTGRTDPVTPTLEPRRLRVGVLGGWFASGLTEDARIAVAVAAEALDAVPVTLDGAEAARSAAFCLTGMAGASLHADRLRTRAMDYDPAVRDRLLAAMLLPADLAFRVRRVRRKVMAEAAALFRNVDVLLAPATPCAAPPIGAATIEIDGREVPVRANLGMYTQPISFLGLPVVAAPIRTAGLPVGVQLIGPAWGEAAAFSAAARLVEAGVAKVMPVTESATA